MNAIPMSLSVSVPSVQNRHKDNFHGRMCELSSCRFQICTRNCTQFWYNCVQLQFTPLEVTLSPCSPVSQDGN